MIEYLNPLSWFRWCGQFISGWFLSLPFRMIPRTVPAIFVLGLLLVCLIASGSQNSGWRDQLLSKQLQSAIDRDDYAATDLVLNRKLRMTPDDTDLLYQLGLTKDSLDEPDAAESVMHYLVDEKRDAQAAYWLLQKKLDQTSGKIDKENADEFGKLLRLIYRERPRDRRVREMYAQYLVGTGSVNQAIPLLDALASTNPMYGLTAAKLSRNLGNESNARRFAERALDSLKTRLDEEPSNASLTIAVVQAQVFLDQHRDAIKVLDRTIKLAKTDQEKTTLAAAIGDVVVDLINTVEKKEATSSEDDLKILQMLQFALRSAPNNPRVLTLVADRVLATMDDDDDQIRAIRSALVSGSSPGIAHFIRGTAALIADEQERAETSLELAAKQFPNTPAILNNLAVVLARKSGPDLERALKLSEKAIAKTPVPTPHLLETRGQILFRLKRYVDAIPDLELAVTIDSIAPAAHRSLAVCYEKIGEPEIAAMHRDAIETEQQEAFEVELEVNGRNNEAEAKNAVEDAVGNKEPSDSID